MHLVKARYFKRFDGPTPLQTVILKFKQITETQRSVSFLNGYLNFTEKALVLIKTMFNSSKIWESSFLHKFLLSAEDAQTECASASEGKLWAFTNGIWVF